MKEYWSKQILELSPYVPGEQPVDRKYIKLNTNESPYPPSAVVLDAIRAESEKLNLYPDPEFTLLKNAISELCGVSVKQVFAGNGSDEILAMCFPAFFDNDRPIIFPDVTYSFYPVYASLFGIEYELVPVNSDFSVSIKNLEGSAGGVIIANPNAPTGIAMTLDEIDYIADSNPWSVVIVDEAYVDFGAKSAVGLINKYKNLLVVRTMSKSYSLAGLRVGWAMGSEGLIAALNTVKNSINSYTLSRLAIAGGTAALKDRESFERNCSKITRTRERVSEELKKLGFMLTSSSANFLFAAHSEHKAESIQKALRERSILVRRFDAPKTANHLRITIGRDDEMDSLLAALREFMATSN